MKDYYEILEVHNKASIETIKKVFKLQVKRYHPDTVPEEQKEIAERKIKDLNEAYDILSDENKRKEYDNLLNQNNSSEKEKILQEQVDFLKEKLQQKEQIIEHFLGGLDLSEYENNKINKDNMQTQNINTNETYYNENPTTLLEKIQNFFNPNRPYKNIFEQYIHIIIVFLLKILGLIIAMFAFFGLLSLFLQTNIFNIIFNAFFR